MTLSRSSCSICRCSTSSATRLRGRRAGLAPRVLLAALALAGARAYLQVDAVGCVGADGTGDAYSCLNEPYVCDRVAMTTGGGRAARGCAMRQLCTKAYCFWEWNCTAPDDGDGSDRAAASGGGASRSAVKCAGAEFYYDACATHNESKGCFSGSSCYCIGDCWWWAGYLEF